MQAFKKLYAEPLLKQLNVLANCAGRHMQLLSSKPEAEVAGSSLKSPQRVKGW
jgi:hypothetical protein